jgi:hypothetical protein
MEIPEDQRTGGQHITPTRKGPMMNTSDSYRRRALLCLSACALAAMMCLLSGTPALAVTRHILTDQFGVEGAGNGQLAGPIGIAVSQSSEDVYVVDQGNSRVEIFSAAGAYVSQFNGAGAPTGTFASPTQIAVDNSGNPLDSSAGDVYVVDAGHQVVDKFSPAGMYLGRLGIEGASGALFHSPQGVGVTSEGDVWVSDGGTIESGSYAYEFSNTGALIRSVELVYAPEGSLALDSANDLYVVTNGRFTSVYSSAAGYPLDGTLGSDSVVADAVDPLTGQLFNDDRNMIEEDGPVPHPAALLESFPSEGLSESYGIAVSQSTGTVYVSEREADAVQLYTPLVYPAVSSEAPSHVAETTAAVSGEVNPSGVPLSGCEFEYGTEASYGQRIPCQPSAAQLGTGSEPVAVTDQLSGLQPDTTYHYRLSATNTNGSTYGGDEVFTTLSPLMVGAESFSDVGSASAALSSQIDAGGRETFYSFEYGTTSSYGTSTPEVELGAAHGAVGAPAHLEGLQADTTYHFRVVAHNQSGTVVGADATFATLPAGSNALPDGRGYELVSPAENQNADVYVPAGNGGSADGHGITTELPFQAAVDGGAVAYLGDPTGSGSGSSGVGKGNEYMAVRSAAGGWAQTDLQPRGRISPVYQAFSPDLSVGVLDTAEEIPPLAPEAPGEGYDVLYTRASGSESYRPLFTQRPPNREPGQFGAIGTLQHILTATRELAYAGASADFRELLFEANDALTPDAVDGGGGANNLYESIEGRLQLVNVLPNGTPHPGASFGAPNTSGFGEEPPNFAHDISDDGSRIFWSALNEERQPEALYVREQNASGAGSSVQVDAAIGGGGRFWTAAADGGRVLFSKADLYEYDVDSAQLSDLAPGAEVQGVLGADESLTDVYFVGQGVVAGNENQNGEHAEQGQENLYHLHVDGAVFSTTFIAQLSPADNEFRYATNDVGDWKVGPGFRTAEVSPLGDAVTFMSQRNLTGYDSGGSQEVYVYDGQRNRLVCASCDPSGAPPRSAAAALLEIAVNNSSYQPRTISADGTRVFFNTPEALVAQDTDRAEDVYEWEVDGAGSCARPSGCVYLLSGGTSEDGGYFIDAGASGDDVFIATRARLLRQDENENFDVYDVHVGAPRPVSPPVCSGAGCQGVPPAPPIFATPASVTFGGVGNFPAPAKVAAKPKRLTRAQQLARAVKACRKQSKPKRAACEAQARKRYGAKSKAKRPAQKKRPAKRRK